MKLCVSIAPRTMSEALRELRSYAAKPYLVEIRGDAMRNLDVSALLLASRPKLIFTHRTAREGGSFNGSLDEHVGILSKAIQLGAEYVDVELSCGMSAIDKLAALGGRSRLIVSYHNQDKTPRNLFAIYDRLAAATAGIVKIAVTARDITDSAKVLAVMERARKDRRPIIAIAMGERGELTRVLGGKFGAYLAFASSPEAQPTAPGQIDIESLDRLYRAGRVSRQTKVFGLVGNPVSQSRGIYFHNNLFRQHSLDAVYLNFLVDELAPFIATFKPVFAGLSITMPFKQQIIRCLDHCEENASRINAVNTVLKIRGKLSGYNTDALAVASLLKKQASLRRKQVVILGTGGMARALAYVVSSEGAQLTILGRSATRAQSLADEFGGSWGRLEEASDLSADVVMNGTPMGMQSVRDDLLRRIPLRRTMIVLDAVYRQGGTALVRRAQQAGCVTIDGERIFKRQATLQSGFFRRLLE